MSNVDGSVGRYKACLTARGNQQLGELDFGSNICTDIEVCDGETDDQQSGAARSEALSFACCGSISNGEAGAKRI